MRMINKKWDRELYQGDWNEDSEEYGIDKNYNDDKEQYINDYWCYVNDGETYAE